MTLMCGLLGLPPVNGVLPQSPLHSRALCQVDSAKQRAASAARDGGAEADPAGTGTGAIPVRVIEQRLSGLLQSLGVAVLLGITPAIRQIPTAVLWGFFAFMALESLPGSQFWDRMLLLLTDPKKYGVAGLLLASRFSLGSRHLESLCAPPPLVQARRRAGKRPRSVAPAGTLQDNLLVHPLPAPPPPAHICAHLGWHCGVSCWAAVVHGCRPPGKLDAVT